MSLRSRRLRALSKLIQTLDKRIIALKAKSNRFSWYRLAVFVGGLGVGVLVYYFVDRRFGWSALAATLIVFNVVAYFHRRVNRSIRKHDIWLRIKKTQVARVNLDWKNLPVSQTAKQDPNHPFEIDLDVTGPESLHQLLDTAVSRNGSDLLRQWLLETEPQLDTIARRQRLVAELAPLARFRDKLQMSFYLVSKQQLESQTLLHWLQQPAHTILRWLLPASTGLAVLNIILFALNLFGLLGSYWIATLTVYFILYFMNWKLGAELLDASNVISDELHKFRALLHYLEKYPFGKHENVSKFCRPLLDPQRRPSAQLRRATWLGAAIGLRMNPVFRLALNLVVPWDLFLVRLVDRTKTALADRLPAWLSVLFELEALISLSNYAYLNPGSSFPEIKRERKGEGRMTFRAEGLGHPLIPADRRVCNDFTFQRNSEIVLITGSNMSGKSTFIKTIGINLCLALAGGPVNARRLETCLFRLYTCIKINDSVTGGFSFFYAEVKRLKSLLNALETEHATPLLFLIDEIFKGTNNRERLIGGRAFIQALVGQNGLGAVTTHDLELTNLADMIAGFSNCHFREDVQNGEMVFDFTLRPGPCPTTNALKIMQMEGLPVEGEQPDRGIKSQIPSTKSQDNRSKTGSDLR